MNTTTGTPTAAAKPRRGLRLSKAWQDRLKAQAQRIDAMSLRERIFLFLSVVAVLAALLDTGWLAPLRDDMQRGRNERELLEQQIKQLREQYSQSARQLHSPEESEPQRRLSAAQADGSRLRENMARQLGGVSSDEQLPALLGMLLTRHPRLSLRQLELLGGPPPQAAGVVLPGLQWQGVELVLSGDYLDQMQYLSQLERSAPKLRWGEMRLRSLTGATPTQAREPIDLQLQLYLLRAASP